ncbi:unnamed protein product [Protopolystoma xenopodis]|uniref:Uncharacterized protein n=1 Tax=Protopolystoma xenopodis TaxID=117903 RepID=A0A448WZU1_9PLAT|nr:unnamed protein product [Protopolystoma xenopodis]
MDAMSGSSSQKGDGLKLCPISWTPTTPTDTNKPLNKTIRAPCSSAWYLLSDGLADRYGKAGEEATYVTLRHNVSSL